MRRNTSLRQRGSVLKRELIREREFENDRAQNHDKNTRIASMQNAMNVQKEGASILES